MSIALKLLVSGLPTIRELSPGFSKPSTMLAARDRLLGSRTVSSGLRVHWQ